MKTLFQKLKSLFAKADRAVNTVVIRTKAAVEGPAGEAYVDTGVKVLIGVVIGALILGGLYLLFKDTVLPTLTDKITDMFSYSGAAT